MLRGHIYRIQSIIKMLLLYISVSSFFITYSYSLMVCVSKHLSTTLFVMTNSVQPTYLVIFVYLELVNITEVARKS